MMLRRANPSSLFSLHRALLRRAVGIDSFHLLIGACAVFFGLLATTAEPLLIAMGVGSVGMLVLLGRPNLIVWIVVVGGLVSGAFISLAGEGFAKLSWVVSALSFLLFALSLPRLATSKALPPHVWLTMLFMIVVVGASLIQWHSSIEFLAGAKRYFQGFGLFFALAVLPFTDRDWNGWRRAFATIAVLQLPFCLFEFLVLVPMRGGLGAPGSTDVVAGTFEANLTGGSANAPMATFLIIALAFALARWQQRLLSTKSLGLLTGAALLTLLLGEVKVVLVMLPLVAFIIFRDDVFERPLFFLGITLVGAVTLVFLGYVYAEVYVGKSAQWVLVDTIAYNTGSRGYGNYLLNRTTVLTFWWAHHGADDPLGLIIGHGLGSSFMSTQTVVPGHVAAAWPQYGIGLTAASTLLWDTGLLGSVIFLSILLAAWIAAGRLRKQTTIDCVRADASAIQAAVALFFLLYFYQDYLVTYLQLELIVAAVLGYLTYLLREQAKTSLTGKGNAAPAVSRP